MGVRGFSVPLELAPEGAIFRSTKMNRKYQELLKRRERAKQRLIEATKNFKGVRHEDSASELQELQLKVARAHLVEIEEELRKLGR